MKRHGDLFHDVCSLGNLALAHKNASRGKRHYREVKMVNSNPDCYLKALQLTLAGGRFRTAAYIELEKNEYGKPRKIHKLPYFPDRIVHHAIVQVAGPVWDKTLIRDTYACIRGRGIHDGVRRVKGALRDREGTRYCLKMDVRQFYSSMRSEILKNILVRKIKDSHFLDLVFEIIDSFPGGVPIGNYLSQFFGNLYLSGYDHAMKEGRRCRYYFRYCDDVVVLGPDKARLHSLRRETERYWKEHLGLDLKDNWQVFPVDARGIDFLGYRFFHGYTLLRRSIATKMKRRTRFIKKHHPRMNPASVISSIMGYNGWLLHGNCLNLRKSCFDEKVRAAVSAAAARGGVKNPISGCFI